MKFVNKLAILAIALSWSFISTQALVQSTEPAVMCEWEGMQYPIGKRIDITDYSFRIPNPSRPCNTDPLPLSTDASCGTTQSMDYVFEKLVIQCTKKGTWREKAPKPKTKSVLCSYNCQDAPAPVPTPVPTPVPVTCTHEGQQYNLGEQVSVPLQFNGAPVLPGFDPSDGTHACAVIREHDDASCGTRISEQATAKVDLHTCTATGWHSNIQTVSRAVTCTVDCKPEPAPAPLPLSCVYGGVYYAHEQTRWERPITRGSCPSSEAPSGTCYSYTHYVPTITSGNICTNGVWVPTSKTGTHGLRCSKNGGACGNK